MSWKLSYRHSLTSNITYIEEVQTLHWFERLQIQYDYCVDSTCDIIDYTVLLIYLEVSHVWSYVWNKKCYKDGCNLGSCNTMSFCIGGILNVLLVSWYDWTIFRYIKKCILLIISIAVPNVNNAYFSLAAQNQNLKYKQKLDIVLYLRNLYVSRKNVLSIWILSTT